LRRAAQRHRQRDHAVDLFARRWARSSRHPRRVPGDRVREVLAQLAVSWQRQPLLDHGVVVPL